MLQNTLCTVVVKGVFKFKGGGGGSGGSNSPGNFQIFFFKSEGNEVERKRIK